MAKKFIRHLEFYGFPDQNGYSSDVNGTVIDLSEIIAKNKEQDEEIKDLTGEKASKKDLDALSGIVGTVISSQTEINSEFADAISGLTDEINTLKEIDNEFGEEISAITSAITDIIDDVDEINDAVDEIGDGLSELSGDIETFSAETLDAISGLSEELQEFKEKVEDEYAKKDDVYSKDDIDQMIISGFSGYTTEEWVKSQGYLTEASADTMYARIEAIGDIQSEISAITESISQYQDITDSRISAITETLETVTSEIVEINSAVETNTIAISGLSESLAGKADKTDLESLSATVSDISSELNRKADQVDLENLGATVTQLNNTKADKEELHSLSGEVGSLADALEEEIERAKGAEAELNDKIEILSGNVYDVTELVNSFDSRIDDLESGLTKEIADRKQADLDLIGTSADSETADTIWGAKNYAEGVKWEAVEEANNYTNAQVSAVTKDVYDLRDDVDARLSSAATTGFVISAITDLAASSEDVSDLRAKLNTEIAQRIEKDSQINTRIDVTDSNLFNLTSTVSYNSSRINAITAWPGTNPEEYDDSGNGILDVLHREFHHFEETYGTIKSIEFDSETQELIITYHTKTGDKQTIIPIAEILVLDNYYTIEETNAAIESAITEAIGDISSKVDESAFTEAVDTINETINQVDQRVSANTNIITNIVGMLGYDGNETLITTNEYEAAFGQFNESHTGDSPADRTAFSIGYGTDDNDRKNIFEVRQDGSVYMWVEGEWMKVNDLLAMLAHETYDT